MLVILCRFFTVTIAFGIKPTIEPQHIHLVVLKKPNDKTSDETQTKHSVQAEKAEKMQPISFLSFDPFYFIGV